MPSKVPAERANAYIKAIESLFACITRNRLRRTTVAFETGHRHSVFFVQNPICLPSSPFDFGFWQCFSVFWNGPLSRWQIRVDEYKYQILNREAHELFAFHWHPLGKVSLPHMHLGFGMRGHDLPIDNKAHIPTGRVPVADIVNFLIVELGVTPLSIDWEQRITTERQHMADAEL